MRGIFKVPCILLNLEKSMLGSVSPNFPQTLADTVLPTCSNKKDCWDSRKPCLSTSSLMWHPDYYRYIISKYIVPYRSTAQNLHNLAFDLSRSLTRSNMMVQLDSPCMISYSSFIIWPNSAPLWDRSLDNLSNLEFDLSRSYKVKYNSPVRLPIYDFLLAYNSK